MNFILTQMEGGRMVNFDELRATYIKFCDTRDDYWRDLEIKARSLTKGFYDYLGVNGRTYKNNQGEDQAYLQLGVMGNDGKFKQTHSFIRDDDLNMQFALKLTIDRGENIFPKDYLIILFSLKKDKERYIVSFIDNNKESISYDVASCGDIERFYIAVSNNIMNIFNAQIF